MCGVKLKDRLPSKELRERLGVDDIALVLQQNRLRWYGHMLQKDDDDWVKKWMEYEVEGSRPRGRPKKTWKEVVREDCQACKLNKEDAMDRGKQIHQSSLVTQLLLAEERSEAVSFAKSSSVLTEVHGLIIIMMMTILGLLGRMVVTTWCSSQT